MHHFYKSIKTKSSWYYRICCVYFKVRIKVYRDSQCAHEDAELSKEWQHYWDDVETATCKDMGSDAGYSFDYSCESDGFHTTYYSGETCNTSAAYNRIVDKWGKCQQSAKVWTIMTLEDTQPEVITLNETAWGNITELGSRTTCLQQGDRKCFSDKVKCAYDHCEPCCKELTCYHDQDAGDFCIKLPVV